MTNGSSQGLFVIVAVVIFGIFVLVSYLLFRDTMKPSLAKIYCDAFAQTEERTGIKGSVCGSDEEEDDEDVSNLVQGNQRIYLEHKLSDSSKEYSYTQQINKDFLNGREPRTGGSATAEVYTKIDDSLTNIDVSQITSYQMGFEMFSNESEYPNVSAKFNNEFKDYFNNNISDYFTQQSTYTVKYRANTETTDYIKSMKIDGQSVNIPKESFIEGQNLTIKFDATTVQNSFKAETIEVNEVKNYNEGNSLEFMDEIGKNYTVTGNKLEVILKSKPINVNVTLKSGKQYNFTITPKLLFVASFYK